MRSYLSVAGLLAALAVSLPGAQALALEKAARRVVELDAAARGNVCPSGWWESVTTTVSYYNVCNGWVWTWSNWSPGEAVGVNVDFVGLCTTANAVCNSWALHFSAAPSGYGFTGTISLRSGHGCTGSTLATQPYLPTTGWNQTVWDGVFIPNQFALQIDWAAPSGFTNPTGLASDHPAAGPTGPAACGSCFSSTRLSNSRYYGVGGAYCPSGTALSDGLCDVEFLVDVQIESCAFPVSVEEHSWGQIKTLYR